MITGSCLCGDSAWEAAGPLELMHHCHCSMCRKSHGTAFSTAVAASSRGFRWRRVERVQRYVSSPGIRRAFCSRCGSSVPGDPFGEKVFMPAGCLDDDPGVRAMAHIFVASKAPWHEITDSLPRFDEYPPGYDTPKMVNRPALEARPGTSAGSCLCAGVAYEIDGSVGSIWSCHCSRCRKARSAAHASNAFIEAAAFRWLRGEDRLASYKIPEAKRFTQTFCTACGSIVPRVNQELGRVTIPAGSLDAAPGACESSHIFVASKAPWFEITGDLPRYEEYPPG